VEKQQSLQLLSLEMPLPGYDAGCERWQGEDRLRTCGKQVLFLFPITAACPPFVRRGETMGAETEQPPECVTEYFLVLGCTLLYAVDSRNWAVNRRLVSRVLPEEPFFSATCRYSQTNFEPVVF
jgi:hypothetical protein